MGVVSIGGLVVAHVGRRLLLSRTPRQCAMPRHNGKNLSLLLGAFFGLFFHFGQLKDPAREHAKKHTPSVRGCERTMTKTALY